MIIKFGALAARPSTSFIIAVTARIIGLLKTTGAVADSVARCWLGLIDCQLLGHCNINWIDLAQQLTPLGAAIQPPS